MPELLPCPFCGAPPNMKKVPSRTVSANYWWVGCEIRGNNATRDLVGCGVGHSAWSESEAAAKWNTRTPSNAAVRAAVREIYQDFVSVTPETGWTGENVRERIAAIITKHLGET